MIELWVITVIVFFVSGYLTRVAVEYGLADKAKYRITKGRKK